MSLLDVLQDLGFTKYQASIISLYNEQTQDYVINFFERLGYGKEIGEITWGYIVGLWKVKEMEKENSEIGILNEKWFFSTPVAEFRKGDIILLQEQFPCAIESITRVKFGRKGRTKFVFRN